MAIARMRALMTVMGAEREWKEWMGPAFYAHDGIGVGKKIGIGDVGEEHASAAPVALRA